MISQINIWGVLIAAVFWVLCGTAAQADVTDPNAALKSGWRVCNKAERPVWLAVSIFVRGKWDTKGWIKVQSNKCHRVLSEMTNRYAYYYAETDRISFSGPKKLCGVRARDFALRGVVLGCILGERLGFRELDFKDRKAWTTTLRN